MKYKTNRVYDQFTQTKRFYEERNIVMFNNSMLECIKELKIVNFQDNIFLNLMRKKFSLMFKKDIVEHIKTNIVYINIENEILDKLKNSLENKNGKISLNQAHEILLDIYRLHTFRKDNINKLVKELKHDGGNLFEEKMHTLSKRIEAL
ncbi:MAG TPA: hypothetical protein PKY25_00225 [Bacilli bacterium]|nr:hypothetical protein [Bacilli bacterium]